MRDTGSVGDDATDRPNTLPRWPFRAAMVTLVATLIAAFAWMNVAFIRQTDAVQEFEQLPMASGLPLEISSTGTHTIWTAAASGGRIRPDRPELYHQYMELAFVAADGTRLVPEPKQDGQHYMLGAGQEGRAVWLVEFEEAGTYTFERRRQTGVGSATLLISEGDGLPAGIVPGMLAIGAAGGVVIVGFVVYGVRIRRRVVDRMLADLGA